MPAALAATSSVDPPPFLPKTIKGDEEPFSLGEDVPFDDDLVVKPAAAAAAAAAARSSSSILRLFNLYEWNKDMFGSICWVGW